MATSSRSSSTELSIPIKRYYYDASHINRMDQKSRNSTSDRKVAVVYYISKNDNIQHPHFMEVLLSSSSNGLYLRDVVNRLNVLRGNGMANMYSWSSKRSYQNGYVWQDLSEDDLIPPTNGKDEYVLKGSELPQSALTCETASSRNLPEPKDSGDVSTPPGMIRRRNQSWSSFDINPPYHKVSKSESSRDLAGLAAVAVAAAWRGRKDGEEHESNAVELSREEISPPPSNSTSSEVLGGRCTPVDEDYCSGDRTVKQLSVGMKASKLLMQLISCGSVSLKDLRSMKNRGA